MFIQAHQGDEVGNSKILTAAEMMISAARTARATVTTAMAAIRDINNNRNQHRQHQQLSNKAITSA